MYDRPFRWWVQSVMPLVFDDSLSYYEVLAKLTKYIQGLTEDVGEIEKILGTIEGIEDVAQFTEFLERIQAEIGSLDNLQTDTKASLVSAINEVALKADIAYWKPPTGIPESDLSQEVKDKLNRTGGSTEYIINGVKLNPAPSNNSPTDLGLGTYTVPDGGIPWNTLSSDVRDRITGSGSGGTTNYDDLNNKPQINGHTLNAGDNSGESLGLGNYDKPITGIPESDLSAGVQKKLNTSGNIADSEDTFVATRDYQPGELVYINGKLYKTRYLILTGTNLIPGNNIEETDINAELEKINEDIESLQSGSGPDSWSLVADLTSNSTATYVNFFEYFNAISGENYLFICTPNQNNESPYEISILKRDGTVVYTSGGISSNNQTRFTFTPVDNGEYYCRIRKTATTPPTETDAVVKVELQYTASQGMTELWNKVNEAISINSEVPAIKALVEEQQEQLAEQQIQLNELSDIPEEVDALNENVYELTGKINDSEIVISREPTLDYGIGNIRISDGTVVTTVYNRCYTGYFPINGNLKVNAIPADIRVTFRFYHYDVENGRYVYDGYTDYLNAEDAQNAINTTQSTIMRIVFGYQDNRSLSGMTDFSDFSGIVMYRYSQYETRVIPFYLRGIITDASIGSYRSTPYILLKRGDTVDYSVWMRGVYKYMVVYTVNKTEKLSKLGTSGVTKKFEGTYTATDEYEYIRFCTIHSSNQYYVEDGYAFVRSKLEKFIENTVNSNIMNENLANRKALGILCAKEVRYNDGTKPSVEFYVLGDSDNNVYISYDLVSKFKIFTFEGTISRYKFGVRKNNDIIAVYRNEFDNVTAEYGPNLDGIRRNPFVFIAEEHYATQHEVQFGTFNPNTRAGLKPTGWLENVGFCSLPNGDIIFVEYTREGVVYTANCWKISANSDISLAENWVIKKQFLVAQNDQLNLDDTYIEHIHSVQHDPYTGTVYITTGDLDKKAQIYYSIDNGETFVRQSFVDPATGNTVTYGQKLFRLLNINFAENDVYWSSDSSSQHVVIHCQRSNYGGLNPNSVEVLATLPNLSGTPATYGSVYLEQLNALVLMESCDTNYNQMAFRVFDLTDNTVKTMCTIRSVGGVNTKIGFRTEYTEFEPLDSVIKVGYGNIDRYANKNAICGNPGGSSWFNNINNLNIRIYLKADGSFIAKFGCYYL